MIIGFALLPYEGETLYSWVARFVKHSVNRNENSVLEELFGIRRYARRIRYMNRIGYLSKMMNEIEGFTINELLDNMSYLNMSRSFFSEERYSRMRYGLIESSSSVKRQLGFHLNGLFVSDENSIKVCPVCFFEDREMYGEAYIHRHHNVVGIRTCYKHCCYLESLECICHINTPIIDIDECYTPKDVRYPNSNVAEQHKKLNMDITYILEGNLKGVNQEIIDEKIMNKLNLSGIHTRLSNANHPALKGFLDDLGIEFLKEYESDFSLDDRDIWLRKFIYSSSKSKKAIEINPLRQVLAISYLFGSIKDFNEFNKTFEPFGLGPYPCNNSSCSYYHDDVIESYKLSTGRPFNGIKGIFTCCHCGFSYLRSYNPEIIDNPYKYVLVKDYGEVWKNKLKALVVSKDYTIAEIAELMRCHQTTVVKYSYTLGLENDISSQSKQRHANREQFVEKKILLYRKSLTEYIKLNPNKIRTEIYREVHQAYRYLLIHDREWLESVLPEPQYGRNRNSFGYSEGVWRKKEENYCEMICNEVENIQNSQEKVIITRALLARRIRYGGFLNKNVLMKMPRLKELIEELVETQEQYLERVKSMS